jgi:hypothetical protein
MNLEERVKRLEAMIPREIPYDQIYDFLFAAEQTIPGPPGSLPENEALRRLGPRDDFINDFRQD